LKIHGNKNILRPQTFCQKTDISGYLVCVPMSIAGRTFDFSLSLCDNYPKEIGGSRACRLALCSLQPKLWRGGLAFGIIKARDEPH
jgi:hypothetical protein